MAVAVILSIANNNPIENANKAKFQNDLKEIESELNLTVSNNYINEHTKGEQSPNVSIASLKTANNYQDKLCVINNKLYYTKPNLTSNQETWAEEIGVSCGGLLIGNNENFNNEVGITISDDGLTLSLVSEDEKSYYGDETNIIIQEGIQNIGDHLFDGLINTKIESVSLPSTLKNIGTCAFQRSNLKNIDLPIGLVKIGNQAFGYTKIKSIKISGTVNEIGDMAFEGNNNLEIYIPASVTKVGDMPFYGSAEKVYVENDKVKNLIIASEYGMLDESKVIVDPTKF